MDELTAEQVWETGVAQPSNHLKVAAIGELTSELTRLRAELAEANRHAKVLAEMLSPYKEYSDEVEAALDYVEKLP